MKKSSLLFLTFLFSCAGCDESSGIQKVCLLNYPCYFGTNNETITNNFPELKGECILGTITYCDKDNNFICEGAVIPTTEVCDGRDNNCDGSIDEGYDKDQDGFTTCFGDCEDNNQLVFPTQIERCDNVDNDCDGQKDEDLSLECFTLPTENIIFGENSICAKGKQVCSNGIWRSCAGAILPRPEVCNDKDDDCDGEIDEPEENFCGPAVIGVCSKGTQVCLDNEVSCINAVWPQAETCDGNDNDCNGFTDENLYRPCSTLCELGIEECRTGNWINCSARQPIIELCDGEDNDCDGVTDEDCECANGAVQVCLDGLTCGFGVQFCLNGEWGMCSYYGTAEETCNNWDDDCDGSIDGMSEPCGENGNTGMGLCVVGTSSCSLGIWTPCLGEVPPSTEVCDNEDNDCDGLTDENINPREKVDLMFVVDVSGSMCPIITTLASAMSSYVSLFQGTEHRFGLSIFPSISNPLLPLEVITSPPLTDVSSFISTLSALTCNGGGLEPSYDAMLLLTNVPSNTTIGWRVDAYPYIVLVGDEEAQSWSGTTETTVATQTGSCVIGGCVAGDDVEFYVLTTARWFAMWDEPTYFDSNRLIDIYPINEARYVNVLRGILDDLCVLSP